MSKAQSDPLKENILENILIVDDSPDSLHLLAGILSKPGYKVRLAPDSELALQFAQSTPPDLILLDIMMPEMDGYEVCSLLKASERTKDVPVIFISALNEVFDMVKAFSLGAVDYITKPFQAQEVLARVENQLRSSRLSKQLLEQNAQLAEEIEERKRVEEALRQQKELLQTIFDHIPVMVSLHDSNGQIQLVNRELERVLGWSGEELEAVDLLAECYPDPECRTSVLEHMIAATGKWQDFKTKIRDGRYVDTSWANIRLSNGTNIGIGQDITERLLAELRERKQAEDASILEERNRIARDIHDTLAQVLTGVVVHMEAAKVVVSEDSKARTHITQAQNLARDGLAEARRSVWALRPLVLEQGSLSNALECLVKGLTTGTPIQARCTIKKMPYSLPVEVETNLLRIAQEALTNTLKHADASAIEVELTFASQAISLRIQDNGRGFHPELQNGKGFGLVGMHERIRGLGGQLKIKSQPGQGTEMLAVVPLVT
ncbi:MAG: response regulator, partial [Scytonema sp. RU_4_4]|nr:response regulator [Scytonema sp. RU_4_4]